MNIHFIAIGGSAMHSLAIALHNKGYKVTGSDDVIFNPSKDKLQLHGLLPEQKGWFPNKISSELDAVILGMHAKLDNPELKQAQKLGLKIYSYPEYIYEQSKDKTRVVIAGSHGKTTITSMILHVLNYHEREVDYMVGAQLEGFETMVHLTDYNEFVILEGDEYLSSPIDRRPKFHLYKPNIALLSGVAWDHINVFPTFEVYKDQFKIFTESLTNGGMMVYNEEDEYLVEMMELSEKPIKKYPYKTPAYFIDNGITYLKTNDGDLPLEIFGEHNLQNIMGAKWICQHIGLDEDDFYEAIATFTGASKRLEKIVDSPSTVVFKDFAHSPSKVKATTDAVKSQYSNRRLVACLELHTFSSLNSEFLSQYKGALNNADEVIVFYSPEEVESKGLVALEKHKIVEAFQREGDLIILTNTNELSTYIKELNLNNSSLLLMSSGNYGGLDFDSLF